MFADGAVSLDVWRGSGLLIHRPISSAKGEINGTLYRARHLIKIARDSLKPIPQTDSDTEAVKKVIVKQPLGVIGYVAFARIPTIS